MDWVRSLDATDLIRCFREDAQRMRDDAVEKALRQLRTGKDVEQVLAQLANQLTNRLTHCPSLCMRQAGEQGRSDLLLAARELFQLKD